MMQSPLHTKAIVLRRTNYGEADRILQLMTPFGRQAVIARGARRQKSKLAGGIELFAVSDVVIRPSKGELGVLSSVRLIHFYKHILEDYDRLNAGYDAIKLIERASQTIDVPEWYDILLAVFEALDKPVIPLLLVQTWLYVRYADLLGYELGLVYDIDGQPLQAEQTYSYDISEKGLRLSESGELNSEHIKLLRLITAKSIKTLVQISGLADVLPVCFTVARQHAAI